MQQYVDRSIDLTRQVHAAAVEMKDTGAGGGAGVAGDMVQSLVPTHKPQLNLLTLRANNGEKVRLLKFDVKTYLISFRISDPVVLIQLSHALPP